MNKDWFALSPETYPCRPWDNPKCSLNRTAEEVSLERFEHHCLSWGGVKVFPSEDRDRWLPFSLKRLSDAAVVACEALHAAVIRDEG